MAKFDPEAWAKTQPHTFFSHWPTASHTKCDFCGTYFKDHAGPVDPEIDVALHPGKSVKA